MKWVRELFTAHIHKLLRKAGKVDPSEAEVEAAFQELFVRSTATILVQEPFYDSVRFKGLARLQADEMGELIDDPAGYLAREFGGGKFKINFHDGWNFISTRNFKPQGAPIWKDLPRLEF